MRVTMTALFISVIVLASIPCLPRAHSSTAIVGDIEPMTERLLASLSSAERVGQLMLVTFQGTDLGPDSAIAQLITDYNIGGVVLMAENDNITAQEDTPEQVQTLSAALQQLMFDAAEATSDRTTPRPFVPLFIATTHAGNDQPHTQIVQGTTPLPSYMALGATWNPDYARQVGQIAGSELSAMGINMLLGPALDVLQQPQADRALDLGVNTFGGNPFWVGKMAQAYITGIHEGSQERIAVIAQNFPGLGFADTQPDQEIPVVPRSVEELQQIDLIPYYAVTGQAGSTLARADGIQCANIRFQGENVLTATRPVCVDEQAATQLLNLDYFRQWRERGIVISSPLGTPAIRRYYNTTPLPHRQVAREAFLAGNDLLFLADFGPQPGDDQLANIIDVIEFFAERYEDDPVFRAQVDESIKRTIRIKLSLYNGDISLENVLQPTGDVNEVGQSGAALYPIAPESVTLLAPRRESLPLPPNRNDNIVIFTDVRRVQQCSSCDAYSLVSVDQLEIAIERMYGPGAGAQIRPERINSFSFSQLQSYLDLTGLTEEDNEYKTDQQIGGILRDADWIVFVMLDVASDVESSTVVRYFLEQRPNLVDHAHVIAVALGAPVYLTSTEISKLAAYYALYCHAPPYIDAAARAIFQETSFPGALPISLPAVGYDLSQMLEPDPAQTIRLEIDALDGKTVSTALRTADVLTMPVGQRLTLRTTPLVDRNGNRVPDGTPVKFTFTFVTETNDLQTDQTGTTQDGIATTDFTPNRAVRVQVTASSRDATQSTPVQIIVVEDAFAAEGTGQPSGTPETGAFSVTPAPGEPGDTATTLSPEDSGDDKRQVGIRDFVLSLFGLALMGGLSFSVGLSTTLTVDGGVRVVLGSVVAGLIGYIYYGIGGPGAVQIADQLNDLGAVITTLGTGLVGLIYTWWTLWQDRQKV